ncbi:MAG: ABC transporter permease [Clostridiales bacterium]|nr:ABC transporter permease [Clostridiales bacterium]
MKKLKPGASRPVLHRRNKRGQLGEIWHRIKKNKGAVIGLIILAILVLLLIVSLFMPFKLATGGSGKIRFTAPSWQYPFGTDNQGRNVFYRVIYGTRYSLAIGLGSVAFGLVIGTVAGSYAGYYGGKVDDIILRCSDVLASIPGMLLGMVIVTVLGTSVRNLIIAVGVQCVPQFLRITRASILTIKDNEFVEAAKAIGFSDNRILFTQVLPNGLSPVIVLISTTLGTVIILAASLSYLGFGVPVPHPEWGAMISSSRDFIRTQPYLITFPGLFIMITVLAFNLVGDGLRDALDPKLKR